MNPHHAAIDTAADLWHEAHELYVALIEMAWTSPDPRINRIRDAAFKRFLRRQQAFLEA